MKFKQLSLDNRSRSNGGKLKATTRITKIELISVDQSVLPSSAKGINNDFASETMQFNLMASSKFIAMWQSQIWFIVLVS